MTSTEKAQPIPAHVTIEGTKKPIKLQFVLAGVLLIAGLYVVVAGVAGRRDIGLWMIAIAIVWELVLRGRRWWEHG
jgi:hypothetical protein